MARVKLTAKDIESDKPEVSAEDRPQLAEGEEDISQVDADLSELMGSRVKPPPTLRFGRSLLC